MNLHTLHIEHVMLLTVYTLLTVANSLLYRGMKGAHWFSLYNVFALLGAISVASRGNIPDFLSIVIGNLFVVACYFSLFLSLAALFGRRIVDIYLQGVFALVGVVTMLQYGYFHPDTRLRLIAYSLVLGCQQAHIAAFLFRTHAGILRRAGGAMALILVTLASVNLVRMLGVSYGGVPANYLLAGNFLASIVLINTCLQCGVMVAYVWLTAATLRRDLEVQASTDPLTGLLNRRAIELAAETAILRSRQTNERLSVLTIDLDRFKEINDTFGHNYGDATLITVARCLQAGLRQGDLLARTGGDEFAILLPRTPLTIAIQIADSLRRSIEALEIASEPTEQPSHDATPLIMMTASFGLAQAESASNWEELITRCDKALYAVKRAGGNQILSHRSEGKTGASATSTLLAT